MAQCACGSGVEYAKCCGQYIDGSESAPTAEALMRSRYTAYTRAAIDYVTATHDPTTRDNHDAEAARTWAEDSTWLGLEILSTEAGGPDDDRGAVEFIARFKNDDGEQAHHELSTFSKREGTWYFTTGEVLGPQQVRREGPKVGRNDPCPCGSGKKYKKCCGSV